MRTAIQNAWHYITSALTAVFVCAFAFVCVFLTPSSAYAADVGNLTINQSFTTKGTVPSSVTGQFSYELSSLDDAPLPSTSPYSFTLTGDGTTKSLPIAIGSSASADALVYSHAGAYEYDLKCTTSSDGALSVDSTSYHVTVVIANDASAPGGLSLQSVVIQNTTTNNKSSNASFSHTYTGSAVSVVVKDPPIKKNIAGTTPPEDSMFRFSLSAEDRSYPMPAGSVDGTYIVQIEGDGKAEIGDVTFTQAGEYAYTIKEIDDGIAHYIYDKSVYRVIFTVTEDANKNLEASVKITKDGKELKASSSSVFEFTNHYEGGKPISPLERAAKALQPLTGDPVFMMAAMSAVMLAAAVLIIVAYLCRKRRRTRKQPFS